MSLLATLFPLICWFTYTNGVPLVERRHASLSVIMAVQRRRWVANAVVRDNPYDAILTGNLMGSVSFLASTSALLVLATFAAFGQVNSMSTTLESLSLTAYSHNEIAIHLAVLLMMFVVAFASFTLSLWQFNHFCIMLGALGRHHQTSEAQIEAIAHLNALAARNFNSGVWALYFSVSMAAWFVASWLAILVSLLTLAYIVFREFFSTAHRLSATIAVLGSEAVPTEAGPTKSDIDNQV